MRNTLRRNHSSSKPVAMPTMVSRTISSTNISSISINNNDNNNSNNNNSSNNSGNMFRNGANEKEVYRLSLPHNSNNNQNRYRNNNINNNHGADVGIISFIIQRLSSSLLLLKNNYYSNNNSKQYQRNDDRMKAANLSSSSSSSLLFPIRIWAILIIIIVLYFCNNNNDNDEGNSNHSFTSSAKNIDDHKLSKSSSSTTSRNTRDGKVQQKNLLKQKYQQENDDKDALWWPYVSSNSKKVNDRLLDNNNEIITALRNGRETFFELLHDAGVTNIDNNHDLFKQLPLLDDIMSLYYHDEKQYDRNDGKYVDSEHNHDDDDDNNQILKPIIYGLETCQQFRQTISSTDASIGTSGLFHTGTNLLTKYLQANCLMPNNTKNGIRSEVPWGKHMKMNNNNHEIKVTDNQDYKSNHDEHYTTLPIVLIRDPYSWMQHMCLNHPLYVQWKHTKQHCPNLIEMNEINQQEMNIDITISYPDDNKNYIKSSSSSSSTYRSLSLIHLWSDWYGSYMRADYPRIIVRLEDLIYQPKQLIREICQCAGAVPIESNQFQYIMDDNDMDGIDNTISSKTTTNSSSSDSFVRAMIEYGNEIDRIRNMTQADLLFAKQYMDQDLFRLFRYKPISLINNDLLNHHYDNHKIDEGEDVTQPDSYMQQMNLQSV